MTHEIKNIMNSFICLFFLFIYLFLTLFLYRLAISNSSTSVQSDHFMVKQNQHIFICKDVIYTFIRFYYGTNACFIFVYLFIYLFTLLLLLLLLTGLQKAKWWECCFSCTVRYLISNTFKSAK